MPSPTCPTSQLKHFGQSMPAMSPITLLMISRLFCLGNLARAILNCCLCSMVRLAPPLMPLGMDSIKPSILMGKLNQLLPHRVSPDNDLFIFHVFDQATAFHERSWNGQPSPKWQQCQMDRYTANNSQLYISSAWRSIQRVYTPCTVAGPAEA
jgi:hypothetical protein